MSAKVNLADVVVLQHGGVSGVGGVVGRTVVEGAACGEGKTCIQPILLNELPRTAFQPLAERDDGWRGRGKGRGMRK